jgi:hypothetical protein
MATLKRALITHIPFSFIQITPYGPITYEQNFDLDKSRQKFHHGLKEHHKISNNPKFRCEML